VRDYLRPLALLAAAMGLLLLSVMHDRPAPGPVCGKQCPVRR